MTRACPARCVCVHVWGPGDVLSGADCIVGAPVDVTKAKHVVVFQLMTFSGKSKHSLIPYNALARRSHVTAHGAVVFVIVCTEERQAVEEFLKALGGAGGVGVNVFVDTEGGFEGVLNPKAPVTVFERGGEEAEEGEVGTSVVWRGQVSALEGILLRLHPLEESDDE